MLHALTLLFSFFAYSTMVRLKIDSLKTFVVTKQAFTLLEATVGNRPICVPAHILFSKSLQLHDTQLGAEYGCL